MDKIPKPRKNSLHSKRGLVFKFAVYQNQRRCLWAFSRCHPNGQYSETAKKFTPFKKRLNFLGCCVPKSTTLSVGLQQVPPEWTKFRNREKIHTIQKEA